MDFISNDAGSSLTSVTYYLLFSSVFFLFLFSLLLYVVRLLSYILSEDDNVTLGFHSSQNRQLFSL